MLATQYKHQLPYLTFLMLTLGYNSLLKTNLDFVEK